MNEQKISITAGALTGLRGQTFAITACKVGGQGLTVVGLSEAAAKATRVRVRAAIGAIVDLFDAGVELTVPDLGAAVPVGLDLALAIGVLAALGKIAPPDARTLFVGELSLTGGLRPVRGLLPLLLSLGAHVDRAFVPGQQYREAGEAGLFRCHAVEGLGDVVYALNGHAIPQLSRPANYTPRTVEQDFGELHFAPGIVPAIEAAVTAGHVIALRGPAGAGATMLARRIATILPLPTREEALACAEVQSLAGLLNASSTAPLLGPRPFRAPHHTVSAAGMLGGGSPVRPGEMTLAHGGVLFLDDAHEFRRSVLDAVFATHRCGEALIGAVSFPAKPLLVLRMPPCACDGAPERCTCSAEMKAIHARRVEPILAHCGAVIDLQLLTTSELLALPKCEASAVIRARVTAARDAQATKA